jgi:hypothetical protein
LDRFQINNQPLLNDAIARIISVVMSDKEAEVWVCPTLPPEVTG